MLKVFFLKKSFVELQGKQAKIYVKCKFLWSDWMQDMEKWSRIWVANYNCIHDVLLDSFVNEASLLYHDMGKMLRLTLYQSTRVLTPFTCWGSIYA